MGFPGGRVREKNQMLRIAEVLGDLSAVPSDLNGATPSGGNVNSNDYAGPSYAVYDTITQLAI